jgi:hypothetical protein
VKRIQVAVQANATQFLVIGIEFWKKEKSASLEMSSREAGRQPQQAEMKQLTSMS